MDKVLVDGVPTANLWISVNDVIHKRRSLNDTRKSTLQQEWNNSIKLQHPEETKSDTHLGSIVSKRKAFFESHMKLPVPVTKEQAKPGKMPATLKVCNPNTAGCIMEGVQGPSHFLKDGENAEIITKLECNTFGPIQKHPVVEKRRQLIGLYQAICEKVRWSPFDSRQTISKEIKEKTSPTLQERLQCLLIEDASNQEEKELRSKKQNPEQNYHIIGSITESHLTGHLSINPLNKYHKAGCLEPKSAFNQKRTNHVPRVREAGISWQRSLPLDKAHGSSHLKNTANNEFPQNHRDVFGRTIRENPTDEHHLTFPANQHSAKGKTANSEIENEPTAVGGCDARVGSPLESAASKAHLVSQDKINSLHRSANQMNTPRINQTSNQQTKQIASQLGSAADIDHSEIRPRQSLVLCSLQKQRAKSLSQLESMNSEGAAADEVIHRPINSSTEDSNPNLQLKSISLTKLNDDGIEFHFSVCKQDHECPITRHLNSIPHFVLTSLLSPYAVKMKLNIYSKNSISFFDQPLTTFSTHS
ncbi:uncharacterized protein LOC144597628 isoform X2 [Rhinoraja longicauda]